MNILADLQKRCLEQDINENERLQRERTFFETYYKLRYKNEMSFLGRLSLDTRKKLHPLLLVLYKIKNRLCGLKYTIISDKSKKVTRPIIYAVSHVGKFDIEVVSEAVKGHYYLLTGDYEHLQGTVYEIFLKINGALYFNETQKEDRHIVVNKMISLLLQGGNLMYFPEGTWNLSPNLPVLPCYWGIVEIAKKGNAVVIPIAAEQYGKHFEINVGENIYMENYGSSIEERAKAITDLRDVLATLKWEIWERHPFNRKEILDNEWEEYLTTRFSEWPGFDLAHINGLIYKPQDSVPEETVFAHLKQLKPCRNNVFLWRQR